jgi:Zn-dependent peptidase ImmA (M78 family)
MNGKHYLLIEKKVTEFKQAHGLSVTNPVSIIDLLEDLKVVTLFKAMPDSFSGMALKLKDNRFMLINSNTSIGRQNFTIGHELYHLFVQEDFTFRTCVAGSFDKSDIEEYKADVFSALLLMPHEAILSYIPDEELYSPAKAVSLDTVIQLEQRFKVSRRAILYRLRELDLITRKLAKEYSENVIKSARKRGYDASLYSKDGSNRIVGDGEYKRLARRLYKDDVISESHYASMLLDIGFDIFDETDSETPEIVN